MRIELVIDNLDMLDNGGPTRFSATDRSFEIGREPPRDFVLPDPERIISSRHCEIRFGPGGFTLVDHSTNGTFVNGSDSRLLSPKRLETGDRLQIGRYVVMVRIDAEAGVGDEPLPFSSAGHDTEAAAPAWQGRSDPASNPWAIDGPVAPPVDLQPAPRPDPPPFEGESFGFDPRYPQMGPARDGGSGATDRWGGTGGDTWSQDPDNPGERAALDDVLPETGFDSSRHFEDEDDELQDDPFEINAPRAGLAPPRDGETTPGPSDATGRDTAAPQPGPGSSRTPELPPRSTSARRPLGDPPGSAAASAESHRLLSLIAEAADLDPRIFAARPPEAVAREIGAVLSVVAKGVGDLLRMRASAKTLTRSADRTSIEVSGNNALKFSPTSAAALAKMFGSEGSGYLSAQESFEEAFRDLSEHELITFAAMQKALKRLIDDLAPDAVLSRVPTSVVPFSKKAQAWDVFVNRWDAKTEPFEHGMLDVFLQYFREIYDDSARARRR